MVAMIRPKRAARVALALLFLQLSSATLSAVADGILEAQEAEQVAHIESETNQTCQASHDDLCQICRALSNIGAPERFLPITTHPLPIQPHEPREEADHCLADYCTSHPSRGPPVA
jgi:hypothetical protein